MSVPGPEWKFRDLGMRLINTPTEIRTWIRYGRQDHGLETRARHNVRVRERSARLQRVCRGRHSALSHHITAQVVDSAGFDVPLPAEPAPAVNVTPPALLAAAAGFFFPKPSHESNLLKRPVLGGLAGAGGPAETV